MTVAVYDGPNGKFITQAYTPEDLWMAAHLALHRTGEVWLHGRVNKEAVDRGFTKDEFYEFVLGALVPDF